MLDDVRARWEDDHSQTVVDFCVIGGVPAVWYRVGCPESAIVDCEICVGVDDGEVHHGEFAWDAHWLAVRDNIQECPVCCPRWFVQ